MSKVNQPPIEQSLIQGDRNLIDLDWLDFINRIANGDVGSSFTPTPTNLTTVGTPTITGTYYQNQGFTDFYIRIVPGTSTSSTAGTTYFSLPFDVKIDAPCFAVANNGNASQSIGAVDAATNRAYTPSWSAATAVLTVSGRVRA